MFVETWEELLTWSLEKEMNTVQMDEEKYFLLWGWMAERFDWLLEGAGEVARALKLTKTITNYLMLWKNTSDDGHMVGSIQKSSS